MDKNTMQTLVLSLMAAPIAVCRLQPDAPIPGWALAGSFFSITRTPEELSIVCEQGQVPGGTQMEDDWRALKVEGPLDFALTGILAGLAGALAQAGISLFAISTYDTDYILIKAKDQAMAVDALRQAGCTIRPGA